MFIPQMFPCMSQEMEYVGAVSILLGVNIVPDMCASEPWGDDLSYTVPLASWERCSTVQPGSSVGIPSNATDPCID